MFRPLTYETVMLIACQRGIAFVGGAMQRILLEASTKKGQAREVVKHVHATAEEGFVIRCERQE